MLNRQRLPVPFVRNQDIIVHAHVQRVVRGVTIKAFEEDVGCDRPGFDEVGDGEEGDSFPFHVELAPGGDTVKIAHILELWQSQELLPVQGNRIFYFAVDFQFPLFEPNLRPEAQVEYGEVMDLPLARRKAVSRANGGADLAGHFPRPPFFGGDVEIFHRTAQFTLESMKFKTWCKHLKFRSLSIEH